MLSEVLVSPGGVGCVGSRIRSVSTGLLILVVGDTFEEEALWLKPFERDDLLDGEGGSWTFNTSGSVNFGD
jgi:hypothetical protein